MARRPHSKNLLDKLTEQGYQARLDNRPCDSSGAATSELQRAAWEIGWRAANNELATRKPGGDK